MDDVRLTGPRRSAWLCRFRARLLAGCFVAALLVPAPPVRAQEAGFTRYGIAEGLTMPNLMGLAQDRRGRLWIGTEYGLAAFDGVRFRLFTPTPGVPGGLGSELVLALAPDPWGDGVWVWTSGAGLQRFDPRTDRFTTVDTAPGLVGGRTYVHTVVARPDALWFGTEEGVFAAAPIAGTSGRLRVRRLDAADGRTLTSPSLSFAADGRLWIAADEGVFTAAPGARTARAVPLPSGAGRAAAVLARGGGSVAVGTSEGVFVTDGDAVGSTPQWRLRRATAPVMSLADDPSGALWVGTTTGLWRLPGGRSGRDEGVADAVFTRGAAPLGLPGERVRRLLVDRSGTLWGVASGVLVARPTRPSPFRLAPGPGGAAAPSVLSLLEDADGTFWRGSVSDGLERCEAGVCRRVPVPFAHRREVHSLARGADGVLYAAALEDGLWCQPFGQSPGRATFARCVGAPASMRYPRTVIADRAGRVWVAAAGDGVFVREPGTDKPGTGGTGSGTWHALPATADTARTDVLPTMPLALLDGPDGRVWVGGGGLWRVDPATRRATRVPLGPHRRLRVSSLATSNGIVYAATLGHGVAVVAPEAGTDRVRVRWIGTGDGLPSMVVQGVVHDRSGAVWAATNAGVSRLSPGGQAETFGASDGWPDVAPLWKVATTGRDGRVHIGTDEGVVSFDPATLVRTDALPGVALAAVRVLGRVRVADATYAPEVRLAAGENVVSIDLATGDAGPVRPWTYGYRLVRGDGTGDRETWQPLGRRATLDLAGLAPGRYRLDVRTELAGRASAPRSLALDVAPPWWQTAWFRVLALALLIGLGAAAYRARVGHLLALERTRRGIADDLHDDLGSKLATLATRLDTVGMSPALATRPGHVESLAAAARGLVGDLGDAVWLIDASADRLDALAERIEQAARSLFARGELSVEVPTQLPPLPVAPDVRRHVLLAVREMLHNATRHGTPPVTLRLSADAVGTRTAALRIDVMHALAPPPSEGATPVPSGSRGLATLRRRAAATGGTFALDLGDVPSGGTQAVRATFTAPLRGGR